MEEPLYQDKNFKIEISKNPQEHILYIGDEGRFDIFNQIILNRCLKELAITPFGKLEGKLKNLNPSIIMKLRQKEEGINNLHIAFCQAYIEEENRYKNYGLDYFIKKSIRHI